MKYEDYEDAIVERLKRQGVSVSALPHVDVLNEPRQTTKPQLFVIYQGSDYAERENLSVVSQVETLRFEIFIKAQKRRGKLGIFDLYNGISRCLLGYKLNGARTVITFDSFGYVAGIQNNWQYALTFSFTGYIVENPEIENPALITQITNNVKSKQT
jgi:hypothetical protein